MRILVIVAVLVGLSTGGWYGWKWWHRPPPDPAHRVLFGRLLPAWETERFREAPRAAEAKATMLAAAMPWPGVAQSLEGIDSAWPKRPEVKAAANRLNQAARDAGLNYWTDTQAWGDKPIVLTYEIDSRARWSNGVQSVEVLRVRRLDRLNVEMGLLGHAGGDQPVVLLDRIEAELVQELPDLYSESAEGNVVDRHARDAWRKMLVREIGSAGASLAARRIARREELFHAMEKRLHDGSVWVAKPERLVFGPEYFETLVPYTRSDRGGGPLFLAGDLVELERADRALREAEMGAVFGKVLDLEASDTEAHEVRHAIEPGALPVPKELLSVVGDDDMRFANESERELRAFFGEIHDSPGPPCLAVLHLAVVTGGEHATATPHFFAGHVALAALDGELTGVGLDRAQIAALLDRACDLPPDELRKRAATAYTALYHRPFVAAQRASGRAPATQ